MLNEQSLGSGQSHGNCYVHDNYNLVLKQERHNAGCLKPKISSGFE